MLPLPVRVDKGAIAIKESFAFLQSSSITGAIKLFSVIYWTLFVGSLNSLSRSGRCILQPQPTGQKQKRKTAEEKELSNLISIRELREKENSSNQRILEANLIKQRR